MKLVINACYGGFGLSRAALHELRKMGNQHAIAEVDFGERWPTGELNNHDWDSYCRDIPRDDAQLLMIVEKMGDDANGSCANLRVVEIPDEVDWEIDEYDGYEKVDEKHRSWS